MNSIFSFLKNYNGIVKINGNNATDDQLDNLDIFKLNELEIEIIPKSMLEPQKYEISVKGWMAYSGNLDFHQRWNNGIAMPSSKIICEILGETPGMYRVKGICDNDKEWCGYISKAAIIDKKEI